MADVPDDIGCSSAGCYKSTLGMSWYLGPGQAFRTDVTIVCPIDRWNATSFGGISYPADRFDHCSFVGVSYSTSANGSCSVQQWTVEYQVYNQASVPPTQQVHTTVHIAWANQSTPRADIDIDVGVITNDTVTPAQGVFDGSLHVAPSATAAMATPSVCVLDTSSGTTRPPPCYLPGQYTHCPPDSGCRSWTVRTTQVIDPAGVVTNHTGLVLPLGGALVQDQDAHDAATLDVAFSVWPLASQVASILNYTYVYELQLVDSWFSHKSDFVALSLRATSTPSCTPTEKMPLWAKVVVAALGVIVLLLLGALWWMRSNQRSNFATNHYGDITQPLSHA